MKQKLILPFIAVFILNTAISNFAFGEDPAPLTSKKGKITDIVYEGGQATSFAHTEPNGGDPKTEVYDVRSDHVGDAMTALLQRLKDNDLECTISYHKEGNQFVEDAITEH